MSAEEVGESQSCAICHALLPHPTKGSALSQPKQLPCGHIFHFSCLRDWLFHSESCPMCRQSLSDCMAPSSTTDWRSGVISAIDSWFAWPFNHVDKVLLLRLSSLVAYIALVHHVVCCTPLRQPCTKLRFTHRLHLQGLGLSMSLTLSAFQESGRIDSVHIRAQNPNLQDCLLWSQQECSKCWGFPVIMSRQTIPAPVWNG